MHSASVTVLARGDPSQTQTASSPSRSNTSFFTFLIALFILVIASGALILRTILIRRRYHTRVQEALDAGILSNTPNIQHKPELYEVCVRAAGDTMDWQTLMPICATKLKMSEHSQPDSKGGPNTLHRSVQERLGKLLRRGSTPAPSPNIAKYHEPETLQVAVLIAMPSEHPIIPSLDCAPPPSSVESKRRDSFKNVNDDAVPDVTLGVSTYAVLSDEADP